MNTAYIHASGPERYCIRVKDDVSILSYSRRRYGRDPESVEGCPGWVWFVIEGAAECIRFLREVGHHGIVVKDGENLFWLEVERPLKAEREELRRLAAKHPDVLR